jgi:hypothetical protein
MYESLIFLLILAQIFLPIWAISYVFIKSMVIYFENRC